MNFIKENNVKSERGNHIFWRSCFIHLFLFIIIIIVFWNILSNFNDYQGANKVELNNKINSFPLLQEPKTIAFEWIYNGSKYVITETFYKTVYDYYNSNPDKDCWKEEAEYEICLKEFLKEAKQDNTISKIASDIKAASLKNGLKDDELLELTIAFVQSIPYDEDRFELIIHSDKSEDSYPNYPYEVLYNNKGICAGKTFLAVSLIKEFGYGVAMFDYDPVIEDEAGHIAPAIKCPKEYSSYDSGYCYTETTESGFKIGEIPIDIDDGIAKTRTVINLFEEENIFNLGDSGLGNVEIHEVANGNSYQGIVQIVQTINRIEAQEKELKRLNNIINLLESELSQLDSNVSYYERESEAAYRRHEILGDYASYNEYKILFSQYELAYDKYESRVSKYDKEVAKYNNLVYEYNAAIKDFYD